MDDAVLDMRWPADSSSNVAMRGVGELAQDSVECVSVAFAIFRHPVIFIGVFGNCSRRWAIDFSQSRCARAVTEHPRTIIRSGANCCSVATGYSLPPHDLHPVDDCGVDVAVSCGARWLSCEMCPVSDIE